MLAFSLLFDVFLTFAVGKDYAWNAVKSEIDLSRLSSAQIAAFLILLTVNIFVVFIFSLVLGIFGGSQIEWPYMKACNNFFDKNPADYAENETLDRIKEIAGNNSAALWGLATILSVFFAIDLTLLSIEDMRNSSYGFLLWLFAIMLPLLSLLFALAANADTVIRQAIILRSRGKNHLAHYGKPNKQGSPWFGR